MSRLLRTLTWALACSTFVVLGADIDDLFTVQTGNTHGGCDDRINPVNILDNWHQEAIDSLSTAIDALEANYNQNTPNGERVRQAMFEFFGVPNAIPKDTSKLKGTAKLISDNLQHVLEFFNAELTNVPPASTWLFCNSDWLVQQNAATDVARDFLNQPIIVNGQQVTIANIQAYATNLQGGNVPWWSGQWTFASGYYFDGANGGGNFCQGTHKGLTSTLRGLEQRVPGGQPVMTQGIVQSMMLCPYAFDNTVSPDSYNIAVGQINVGTSLEGVVPKSATLLHEAFHVVHGTNFLQGLPELYLLAECINAANVNPNGVAKKNAESYVYFVASMYFLFGDPNDGVITTNWDFTGGPDQAKAVP